MSVYKKHIKEYDDFPIKGVKYLDLNLVKMTLLFIKLTVKNQLFYNQITQID